MRDARCFSKTAMQQEKIMKTVFKAALVAATVFLASPAAMAADYNGNDDGLFHWRRIFQREDRTARGEMDDVSSYNQFSSGYRQPEELDPAYVRQVQEALSNKGFYRRGIDGVWGRQTTEAIRDYQRFRGEPVTGMLSLDSLRDLGVDVSDERFQEQVDSMQTLHRNSMRTNRH